MTDRRDEGQMPAPDQTPAPYQQQMPGQYPAPTESSPPVDPPTRKGGQYLRLGIGLAIIAVIIGGFFLFRDRVSNEVTSLAPGECFDQPAEGVTEVSNIQRQPCNEPHDSEVIAVLVHTAEASAPFPVVSGFGDYIEDECVPAFETFTGRAFATDTALTLGYFQPTLSGWAGGDRGFTCYITRSDGAKVTGSLRAGSQATAAP